MSLPTASSMRDALATAVREPTLLAVNDKTPCRALQIGEIVAGDAVEQRFAFDAATRAAFSKVADDRAPLHGDDRFAAARGFEGQIMHGLCVSTRFSRLIGMYLPGEHAILEQITFKFRKPTFEGQPLVFRAEVIRLMRPMKVVRLTLTATSEAGVHVTGEAQCLIR